MFILLILTTITLIIIYSACVISGRCSREEERIEEKNNKFQKYK